MIQVHLHVAASAYHGGSSLSLHRKFRAHAGGWSGLRCRSGNKILKHLLCMSLEFNVCVCALMSGAMVYVAIFELMAEAVEQCGRLRTGAIVAIAFCLMTFSQERMKGSIFDSPDGHGGEF
jgi:hypothetical protein